MRCSRPKSASAAFSALELNTVLKPCLVRMPVSSRSYAKAAWSPLLEIRLRQA